MNPRSLILIADDNVQDLGIHTVTLQAQGYRVLAARDQETALQAVVGEIPDLFLIAAGTGGLDGFALCRELKKDLRLEQVPVILVIGGGDAGLIDRAYAAGALDTIVKPCHLNEFLGRVRTHLNLRRLVLEVRHLREADLDANPLTRLPGNNSISAAIQEAIDLDKDVVVIYTDLDDFKAYNDAYGFSAGDNVLLFNAEVLQTGLRTLGPEEGFLGHVGGDNFVLIVPTNQALPIGARIVQLFDGGIPNFYSERDIATGGIVAADRLGRCSTFPIMGISMGGVCLHNRQFTRAVEVAEVCAEVKHQAKAIPGSNLFMDRRGTCRESRTGAEPARRAADCGPPDTAADSPAGSAAGLPAEPSLVDIS